MAGRVGCLRSDSAVEWMDLLQFYNNRDADIASLLYANIDTGDPVFFWNTTSQVCYSRIPTSKQSK